MTYCNLPLKATLLSSFTALNI